MPAVTPLALPQLVANMEDSASRSEARSTADAALQVLASADWPCITTIRRTVSNTHEEKTLHAIAPATNATAMHSICQSAESARVFVLPCTGFRPSAV